MPVRRAQSNCPLLAPAASAGRGPAPPEGSILTATLGGETVQLHAERALYWPREATLFVADVHLGKGAAFRAGGVALPRGTTAADLGRLTSLIMRTSARRLVVLGDFLHAAAGRVEALDGAFRSWRVLHARLSIVIVRGNHDARAGDPSPDWDLHVVDAPYPLAPFLACHEPVAPRTGYALCGHVHPGVRVSGPSDIARLPCFLLRREYAILPAFGRFTGLSMVAPNPRDRIVAIAGARLFPLPQPDPR